VCWPCNSTCLSAWNCSASPGRIRAITGLTVLARDLPVAVGSMCAIATRHGAPIPAQVVGFRDRDTVLMPLADVAGVAPGDAVSNAASLQHVAVGRQMIGRVLDGLGEPLDGKGPFAVEAHYPVMASAPAALTRERIDRPLGTGIRALDALHALGQRPADGYLRRNGRGQECAAGHAGPQRDGRRERRCPGRRTWPRSEGFHRTRPG
jgi:flagellum-specific ATP synthase